MIDFTTCKNADYVKHVIHSASTYPNTWADAWRDSYRLTTDDAWAKAYNHIDKITDSEDYYGQVMSFIRKTNKFTFSTIHQDYVQSILRDAIAALIALDCAHMLDGDPAEVLLLAKLGDPAALLIHPASVAINILKSRLAWNIN